MNNKSVDHYLEKSGDTSLIDSNFYENDQGFITWGTKDDDTLVLYNVYGNGVYWDKFSENLAKKFGFNKIMTATRRSPKAFKKKYGYRVTGYILEKEVN